MACYNLIPAWRGEVLSSGKRDIVFKPTRGKSYLDHELLVPCNNCIGCRLERSHQAAMRCMDEAQMCEDNCFITLTYDEVKLPEDGCLDKSHFPLFMKRLRQWSVRHDRTGREIAEKWQKVLVVPRIKYYHCGEYGDKFGRPHLHACVFGFDFPDRVYHHSNGLGHRFYTSEILDRLWGNGIALIGDVTYETAAYVARYVLKKVNGEMADEHYVDKESGYIRQAEYVTMSRRPGIGKRWYEKFKADCFPWDTRAVRGRSVLPPKYYGNLFQVENPEIFDRIKLERVKRFTKSVDGESDTSPRRLRVREENKLMQIKRLERRYDSPK